MLSLLEQTKSMTSPLTREFEYFLKNQERLLAEYNGKFVVIKDQSVVGSYDDELAAVNEARKQFELGTFLVQKVEPGDKAYTQTYHSRVVFN
jgi:hypothetical protein